MWSLNEASQLQMMSSDSREMLNVIPVVVVAYQKDIVILCIVVCLLSFFFFPQFYVSLQYFIISSNTFV